MNGLWQGVYDGKRLDTTPGADGPFAPPAGFEGDADAYIALLRRRFGPPESRVFEHIAVKQQLMMVARQHCNGETHEYLGPYAEAARGIIEQLSKKWTPDAWRTA